MSTEPVNALFAYVGALVDELARSGVRHVVVCPGSRSTPLALALAALTPTSSHHSDGEKERIKTWVLIDERSAGFFALGLAKRAQSPVALVCTSGTAAANFLPAIVEARLTHVPLVVLTADRPHELRDVGAPQAIDQIHLFGRHVKWFAEVALPEATNAALRYIRALGCRVVATAWGAPAGPVHLNLPFREPLTPTPGPLPPLAERDPIAWQGRADGAPFVTVTLPALAPMDHLLLSTLADLTQGTARGLMIVGPGVMRSHRDAIDALSRSLGYPILADPLADMRGAKDSHVLCAYDAFLRDERFAALAAPDVVLRFGAMPTSKPLSQFLRRHAHARTIVLEEYGEWPDPAQQATDIIRAGAESLCHLLAARVKHRASTVWLDAWRQAEQIACEAMSKSIATPGPLPPLAERDPIAWQGRADGAPFVTVTLPALAPMDHLLLSTLADLTQGTARGLMIVGPGVMRSHRDAIDALSRSLGYPILADPLADMRGAKDSHVLCAYDAFLRDERFAALAAPDVVLRFGAMPTSKPLSQFLRRHAHARTIVLEEYGEWPDPAQQATDIIRAGAESLCHLLAARVKHRASTVWLDAWRQAEQIACEAMSKSIAGFKDVFEGRVFTELAALLPDNATLIAGNSMPVRDCDTFFWPESKQVHVIGNRGANGIDGVVSTALGLSAAGEHAAPVVLVIGDLSFYHDMNGLLAAKLYGLDLTIVLVNNDGGGIFSFLPQADFPEHFERMLGTPTGLDFSVAARLYGARFTHAATWEHFREAVGAGMEQGGLHVVEVATDRATNVTMHRHLWQAVSDALQANGVSDTIAQE